MIFLLRFYGVKKAHSSGNESVSRHALPAWEGVSEAITPEGPGHSGYPPAERGGPAIKRKDPGVRRRPGPRRTAATYSPTWWGSTIGDGGLNFSVRNGKRWIPTAITTAICFLRENNFSLQYSILLSRSQILFTAHSHSLSQRKISGN